MRDSLFCRSSRRLSRTYMFEKAVCESTAPFIIPSDTTNLVNPLTPVTKLGISSNLVFGTMQKDRDLVNEGLIFGK